MSDSAFLMCPANTMKGLRMQFAVHFHKLGCHFSIKKICLTDFTVGGERKVVYALWFPLNRK